ncbi:GNAT family N-acetyltransferase [Paraurantiacibacter namhicola]|uniref:Protease synthase and sporulation negative regulatory protein PAI 1 n=1 Tax=Paraurantiacibacter namhicola TaxID=645517 RepID=A0A1C7DBP2_9SPHN|nr:GNAT family N-acetyltransferase [Paraurantiacibacter namhicola]ANU08802.1 Protease synthase and sporulation negative regulatory protein PAI 1 [Paraurantiacibacter namhicola]
MATILRPACIEDAETLAPFARAAFDAKFGHLYDPEDLASFFAQARSIDAYRGEIARDNSRVMLAERDGALLAYSVTHLGEGFAERPQPHPARPATLSQLYCAADATGMGLGSRLLADAVTAAHEWGADAVQLSVFSENTGAQRFYQRHGFTHVADIDFWVGKHRDDEWLFELGLPGRNRG